MSQTDAPVLPEHLAAALIDVAEGRIVKISELRSKIAPTAKLATSPAILPPPAVISENDRVSIAMVPRVFGSVVPIESRMLSEDERATLMTEREVLDRVEKLLAGRKAGIRTTVLNHFSEKVRSGAVQVDGEPGLDKDGYPLVKQQDSGAPGKVWSAEPREGSADLNLSALKAMAEDPEVPEFTHKDWLAITEPVRVVDENKLMTHLKKHPRIITALAKATETGIGSITVTSRKET